MTNTNLKISYKPLWKQLIDKEMTKTQLQELVGLSPSTLAKLGKDGKHQHRHTRQNLCRSTMPNHRCMQSC